MLWWPWNQLITETGWSTLCRAQSDYHYANIWKTSLKQNENFLLFLLLQSDMFLHFWKHNSIYQNLSATHVSVFLKAQQLYLSKPICNTCFCISESTTLFIKTYLQHMCLCFWKHNNSIYQNLYATHVSVFLKAQLYLSKPICTTCVCVSESTTLFIQTYLQQAQLYLSKPICNKWFCVSESTTLLIKTYLQHGRRVSLVQGVTWKAARCRDWSVSVTMLPTSGPAMSMATTPWSANSAHSSITSLDHSGHTEGVKFTLTTLDTHRRIEVYRDYSAHKQDWSLPVTMLHIHRIGVYPDHSAHKQDWCLPWLLYTHRGLKFTVTTLHIHRMIDID